MFRRNTRQVRVGRIKIGGGAPVSIQSMTNSTPHNIEATLAQLDTLVDLGCEIVRISVPDNVAADAFAVIRKERPDVPLVADIHFDYKMALRAIEDGADKIRINPGNIGGKHRLREIVDAAKDHHVPIRVGVNSGSLEQDLLNLYGATPKAAVESIMRYLGWLDEMDFHDIIVSIKFSDVPKMVEANLMFAELSTDYPMHLGVTEAGTLFASTVASSMGIGDLLLQGIGDTIRVSITGPPEEEIKVAKEILQASRVRLFHPIVTACPTCGRTEIDLINIVKQVEERLEAEHIPPIHIAVMGCVVNGPGEAREADVGLAGGKGKGVIFRKGNIVKSSVPESELVDALFDEIYNMLSDE